MQALDVLAIAAHPDDAELACGGTLIKLAAAGRHVGVLDLTKGELSTRGAPETRANEALLAGQIMGLALRMNVGLPDAWFQNDPAHRLPVIQHIRLLRPKVVLANAPTDRHPDHGRAAQLVREAVFLAGLRKIETVWDGSPQDVWRPSEIYHYIQDKYIHPSFVVPLTAHQHETKLKAIRAYRSQFHDPASTEPETYIASPLFMEYVVARSVAMGQLVGAAFGEGFIKDAPLRIDDPFSQLP